jgi:environmental stress-induced protein Ves
METSIGTVKKSQYRTSRWAGGTTTELLIYPEDSKYSDRSFKWRISSAEVEAAESEFTSLPGISRHIMVTDGQIDLVHEGRYRKLLSPFHQDTFMGDWKTTSHGRATDFNLMLSDGFSGRLEVHFLKEREQMELDLGDVDRGNATDVLYPLNGSLRVEAGSQEFNVDERDLFRITRTAAGDERVLKLTNASLHKLIVIRAVILENEEE